MTNNAPTNVDKLEEIQQTLEKIVESFAFQGKNVQRQISRGQYSHIKNNINLLVDYKFATQKPPPYERNDFKYNTGICWHIKFLSAFRYDVLLDEDDSMVYRDDQDYFDSFIQSLSSIKDKEGDFLTNLSRNDKKNISENFEKITEKLINICLRECRDDFNEHPLHIDDEEKHLIRFIVGKINDFNNEKAQPKPVYKKQVNKNINQIENALSQALAVIQEQIRSIDERGQSSLSEIKAQTNIVRQEKEKALKELQTQKNLNVFANEAEIFATAAKQYLLRARIFCGGAVASLIPLFCIAIFKLHEKNYTIGDITIGGTLLVALLLTILGISVRGYFVNTHNEAHNRHRSNVLRSYKNIYDSTEKEDRKEVVQQTLGAAFQQLPTGFSKQQSDGGSGGILSFLTKSSS